jgi:glycosyltransferase involved in cell wall biosynthesis
MIELPLVSIVTPSYNQARFLEETILSVLNQDYPNVEYLIIDGASTDGSVEIIKKYQDRLVFWASEPDRGQSHAINKGLQHASGEILAWLNSDDVYCPGAVRTVVDFFSARQDIALLYGRADVIDSAGTSLLSIPWEDFDAPTCIARHLYPIPQPAAFFRREAVRKVGPLDARWNYCMDWDYWIRIGLSGLGVSKVPQTLARYRVHGGSKTIKELIKLREEMVAWVDTFFSQPLPSKISALERESRSSALLNLGRENFYASQYACARRILMKGIREYPRNLLRDRVFLLVATSMLPKPAIALAWRLKRLWFGTPPAVEAWDRAARVA